MNSPTASVTLVKFVLLLALTTSATGVCAQDADQVRGEPDDATATREQIAKVEQRLPQIPDRAAALYLLAALEQHLGETREALQNLKDCLALKEGFDPSGSPSLGALKGTKEFDDLVASVHRDFPVVSHAKLALASEEKDLIPEGLAYDARKNAFLLSSMHQRKIVVIGAADGKGADLFPPASTISCRFSASARIPTTAPSGQVPGTKTATARNCCISITPESFSVAIR